MIFKLKEGQLEIMNDVKKETKKEKNEKLLKSNFNLDNISLCRKYI